jgi:hypothetical protein
MLQSTPMGSRADTRSTSDYIEELRAILAAIRRESLNKAASEIAYLVQRADEIAASLLADL